MALWPIQARALWAAVPAVVNSTRMVPWQPPSMCAEVGSMRTAKSASRRSGRLRERRPSPLRVASTSSLS